MTLFESEPDTFDGDALRPAAMELLLHVFDTKTARFRVLPAAFWKALDPQLLRFFCTVTARWTIVTVELVEWLRERIGTRKAIEIGAGEGDLGHALGVPQTDSYANAEDPAVRLRAGLAGHTRLAQPPTDVRKLDGLMAVRAMRPEIVVASWVTEYGTKPGTPTYYKGVRETGIVKLADYILIGNINVHGQKHILSLPHEEHAFPWLVSRAEHPELNRIWVWKRWKR